MPRGRKAKKTPAASKSETTSKRVRPVTSRGAREEVSKDTDTTPNPPPKPDIRSRLRSHPSADLQDRPTAADPEALLRKARKERRKAKAATAAVEVQEIPEEHYTKDQIGGLAQSIEAALTGVSRRVDEINTDNEASEEGEGHDISQDIEEQEFNRSWGYLPPLDDEAVAIIEAIIANPEMAKDYSRITPNHRFFPEGLRDRNVFLSESGHPDPHADEIRRLKSPLLLEETKIESKSHGQLWALDQAKIDQGSNEALFQRTLMMNLIGRHLFIYNRQSVKPCCLDFSVEELWTCPPMPTRSYNQGRNFLTQPKPDLAVCFRREAAIPDRLWNSIPMATKILACYESFNLIGHDRIFHFLTIEAKKEKTSTNDDVGRLQSLNNASQALHNMFEFFRDAGHEDTFFAKVRFFSAVASTEGVWIRIHRATREPEDGSDQGFILPKRKDYPLRFEFRNFAHVIRAEFERATVLEIFEKILVGYGVGILRDLIYNAAKAIVGKLEGNPDAYLARGDPNFYRYGQTVIKAKSRIPTPVASRPESTRGMSIDTTIGTRPMEATSQDFSQTNVSVDMMRSGTTTPIQSPLPVPKQTTKGKGKKRPKSPSPRKMSVSGPEQKRRTERSFSSSTSIESIS
ncbi:uncharacterized protein A1O5_07393 [Cladophialophora psammophila CBS 110553]|uniref:DUF7924 domain-containing protein n=1 Tax=Cladophialophora psammophila CBS 110553 TaxID=1182543 RepID=W9WMI0_9EURO|nr:uncharacterized protein A1O5_07393 [Cladophialophora psammophila CBS 110553]EXJ69357.1 hypothetical protein A1O5_07393 [Cladophialophora psammophila CBS 110553]